MARLRFTLGTRYLYQAHVYVVRQVLAEDRLLVENQSFGGQIIVSIADLVVAWGQGEVQFEVRGPNIKVSPEGPLATQYTYTDFHMLPTRQRDEAWRRYQLLLPLLRMDMRERTHAAIVAYANSLAPNTTASAQVDSSRRKRAVMGQATSARSIERWLNAFIQSGYDIRALIPNTPGHGRKGEKRLNADCEQIVQAVLAECAAAPQYRTIYDVYLMVVNRVRDENRCRSANEQLPVPSTTTLYRRIRAEGIATVLRRRASRAEQQANASVLPGPRPTRILERVEIDHTLLDLFVVDEEDRLPIGRPRLTYALDVYSGLPFGIALGFEPANYEVVGNCLSHGILPKPDACRLYQTKNRWLAYGLPETLIIDNAREFIGRDLNDACAQLGIILERMPIRTPWFKGSIERFFRTNNTGLIHTLPGTTFSNIIDRGDYDVFQHACISMTAFWQILHIFLLDIYSQRWHNGCGSIPTKKWLESVQNGFGPSLHSSAEEVRVLLMRRDDRTLQRHGIDFESLVYQSPKLSSLRTLLGTGASVAIKYDPNDMGGIWVYAPDRCRWISVPAIDQAYARGLSLWKHRIIRSFVLNEQREVNIEALAAAKQHIQKIVAHEFSQTRKSRGRKTAARFLGIGANVANGQEANIEALDSVPALPPQPTTPAALPEPQEAAKPSQATPTPTTSQPSGQSGQSTSPTSPSVSDDDFLDATDWGSDYNLPSQKR